MYSTEAEKITQRQEVLSHEAHPLTFGQVFYSQRHQVTNCETNLTHGAKMLPTKLTQNTHTQNTHTEHRLTLLSVPKHNANAVFTQEVSKIICASELHVKSM